MANKDIIVIAASAGGVDALQRLCAALPADLAATVFVVQHISPTAKSVMPLLLNRVGALKAQSPVDGQVTEPGNIYVAAPDLHMLVRPGHVLMRRGPHENRTRPAANALFRSAAIAYGARVIGIVLTGLLDDGSQGLIAVKAAGGTSLVQDPDDAEWPSMPRNAIARDHVDHVAPLSQMGELLVRLTREEAGPSAPLPEDYHVEDRIAAFDLAVVEPAVTTPGQTSHLSCPDCGGVLNQLERQGEIRFRCQVGHAFTALGLAEAQTAELERALGIAARTHRDRIKLFDQMSGSAQMRKLPLAQKRWEQASEESKKMIEMLEKAMSAIRKPPLEVDD